MAKPAIHALLLVALVAPVALFLLLFSHLSLGVVLSAGIAVASGWGLNLVWARAADPQNQENFRTIALRFGWACPAVLVLVTWAVLHFFFSSSV